MVSLLDHFQGSGLHRYPTFRHRPAFGNSFVTHINHVHIALVIKVG
jgi:hypothetical protein